MRENMKEASNGGGGKDEVQGQFLTGQSLGLGGDKQR